MPPAYRSAPGSLCGTLVIFAALVGPIGGGQGERLKLCYLEWGTFGGEDLPDKGFIPDAASRVLERAGYEVEVSIVPWSRCIETTKKLEFDLVAAAWEGPSFDPDFEYLNNLQIDSINFVVRADSPLEDGSLESLAEKRVGYLRDSGGLGNFDSNQHLFEVTPVSSEAAMLRILDKGRVDAIVSDPVQLKATAAKLEPPLESDLRTLLPAIQRNYGSPLISRNHPKKEEIKAAFDKAYRELVKEGMYEELNAKHNMDVEHRPLD